MYEIEEFEEKLTELIKEFEAKHEDLKVNIVMLGTDEYESIFKHIFGYEIPSRPDICDVSESMSSFFKVMTFVSEAAAHGREKVTNDVLFFKLAERDIRVINAEVKGLIQVGYVE